MKNFPTSNRFILAFLLVGSFLFGQCYKANAQCDPTFGWRPAYVNSGNPYMEITDFGANPNDNLDDTWAFIKASKWLANLWDKQGIPYTSTSSTIGDKIDYTLNYVILRFPASTNGGAYLVGKEFDVKNNSTYGYQYHTTSTAVTIPYSAIFGTVVPVANTEGVGVGIILKYITQLTVQAGQSVSNFIAANNFDVNYSTVPWISTPIFGVLQNGISPIDGIWLQGEPNTKIKKNANMHLGFWDEMANEYPGAALASPITDWWYVDNQNNIQHGGAENINYSSSYWPLQQNGGNSIFGFDGVKNLKITDMEIDGKKQSVAMGGLHPTESIQSGALGIDISNTQNISIENMNIHHNSFDGIRVTDKNDTKFDCKHTQLNYNGRTNFAWISGKHFNFENVDFNYAGKVDELNNSGYGNPNCGIDMEPDDNTEYCQIGTFTNCNFIGNSGVAISCDSHSDLVDNQVFNHCTMWDGDSFGLICKGKNITYNTCNIYCSVYCFGVHGTSTATKFNGCYFEDKNNPLYPSLSWLPYNYQYGTESPCRYLIQTPDWSSPDFQSTGTEFNTCHFKLNGDSREMFRIFTKDVGTTPSSEYTAFDNCDFTFNNSNSLLNFQDETKASLLNRILFIGKNHFVNNNIGGSNNLHKIVLRGMIMPGSSVACEPDELSFSGNIHVQFDDHDSKNYCLGENATEDGYADMKIGNNAIMTMIQNQTPILNCNSILKNSKLIIEGNGAYFNMIGNGQSSLPILNVEGKLIVKKDGYFYGGEAKYILNSNWPQYSLLYLDHQANLGIPPMWQTPLLGSSASSYTTTFYFNPTITNHVPCVQGGNTNLPNGIVPCSSPNTFSHISTNGAFSIMYNLTPNGGNTNISYTPNGNDYTVSFDGVTTSIGANTINGVADGCHILIITDNTTGCGAVAFINTGTNTVPCCEPSITNAANLIYYNNPAASAIIAQNLNVTTISNKTILIDGVFTVDQNCTFINCTFLMRPSAGISIASNKTLSLNNCTIKAACTDMWNGIYADDPASQIVMDGCTLQDAENGISLINNAKGSITNNTFVNNHENIEINLNTLAGTCIISKNIFQFTGSLLAPHATEKPVHGIHIINSTLVDIGDISNANSGNVFDKLSNGIAVDEFQYITGEGPNLQLYVPPYSVVQLFNNVFTNITPDPNSTITYDEAGTGVYAHRADAMFALRVNIYNTLTVANNPSINFDNCINAIWLRNTTTTTEHQKINACGIGIVATECDGKRIRVTNNQLKNTYWGILKMGDETANGFIAANNTITLPEGNENGWISFPPIGLLSSYSSQVHVGRSEIMNNTINMPLGNTGLGITISEGNNDGIFSNQIHMTTNGQDLSVSLPKMIGIYSNNSDAVSMVNNTIDNGGNSNYVQTNNAGIYLNKNNNSLLQCNALDHTKYGIFAVDKNGSSTAYDRTAGNFMNNSDANLMLWKLTNEGTMGQVGAVISISPLNTYDANNDFIKPNELMLNHVFKVTGLNCTQIPNDEIVTMATKLDQNRSSASAGILCRTTVTNPSSITQTYTCPTGSTTSTSHPMDFNYALQVADGDVEYSDYEVGAKEVDEELVMNWLEDNASARANNNILNDFYLERNSGIVGQLNSLDRQISLLNDSSLRSTPVQWLNAYNNVRILNNDLESMLPFAQNAKYMNNLYLNTLIKGRDTLNETEQEDIETLAFTCPYLGGNAVYRARILHGMRHFGVHFDDLEICNGQGVYKNGISKLQEQLNQISNYLPDSEVKASLKADEIIVYPNPAINFITIEYNFDKNEIADFILYDMLGREQFRTKLFGNITHTNVNTINLLRGIYLYKIAKKDKSNYTGKLIIE